MGKYDYLPPIKSANNDAMKMRDFLMQSGEYDEIAVLQDAEATYDNIRYFMSTYFLEKMNKPGRYRFLFYFTGHGSEELGYRNKHLGFLQLKSSRGKMTDGNIVDMDQIENWAERYRYAHHMLFLLDCCFSGLAGVEVKSYDDRVDPSDLAKENGRFMMTAGGPNEESIADLKTWGGSLFTDVAINGMKGHADKNNDGVVTTYELFSFTQAAVQNESKRRGFSQTPLINNLGQYFDKGQYFFVYKDIKLPMKSQKVTETTETEKKGVAYDQPTLPVELYNFLSVNSDAKLPFETELMIPGSDVHIKLVGVPKGEFKFGMTTSQVDSFIRLDKLPFHDVEEIRDGNLKKIIDYNFLIGKFEITEEEFAGLEAMNNNLAIGASKKPATSRSLEKIRAFCAELENLYYPELDIALPKEMEWEYAARGPRAEWYTWGNKFEPGKANVGSQGLWEVGTNPNNKSWCGAVDMLGNAEEVCEADRINYVIKRPEPIVSRGGSYMSTPYDCRTTSRHLRFNSDWINVGFRILVKLKKPHAFMSFDDLALNIFYLNVAHVLATSPTDKVFQTVAEAVHTQTGEKWEEGESLQEHYKKKFDLPVTSDLLRFNPQELATWGEQRRADLAGAIKRKIKLLENHRDDPANWHKRGQKDFRYTFVPLEFLP